jgi:hypothetical protein
MLTMLWLGQGWQDPVTRGALAMMMLVALVVSVVPVRLRA